MRRRVGFTLVEVLIVAAILAVLAAIVFSATVQSRRSGHTAACTSNLRQAAQALEVYLQDSDGTLPDTLYHDFSPILPYLGDASVLACPLDPYSLGANFQSTRATGKRTLDPNHGVFACVVHGERVGFNSIPTPISSFRGLVLRARKDTSVQRRQVFERCFVGDAGEIARHRMYWDFFTDEKMPMDVQNVLISLIDAREMPCP